MENFLPVEKNDIVIEIVNLVKATRDQAEELKSILQKHINNEKYKIILDLNHCEFIDSTFLAVMITAQKELIKKGGSLKISSPQTDVATVLEVTNMKKVFEVYDSTSEAIESF
ncbi:MAG: STAS domain-containing protein [Ignavibacteria bacterium]|jgi:anti-sigma B factor antagonist